MKIDVESLAAGNECRPYSCSVSFGNKQQSRSTPITSRLKFSLPRKFATLKLLAFEITISFAILGVLFLFIDISTTLARLRELKLELLLTIVSILCLQFVIAAWLWYEILKIMGRSQSHR